MGSAKVAGATEFRVRRAGVRACTSLRKWEVAGQESDLFLHMTS